jgi:ABC-type cobalamin transport system ATPase subunit
VHLAACLLVVTACESDESKLSRLKTNEAGAALDALGARNSYDSATRAGAPDSLIAALRDEGTSILMSTHYIEEAERLADTVSIMAKGRVVARGRPAELVREHAGQQTLEVYGPPAR